MSFDDENIQEELWKTIPWHGKTKTEDISKLSCYLLEMNVAIHILVSVTTDGAPVMTSENIGLIGLCKKDRAFPGFFTCHCVIHQQAAYTEVIDFQHVIRVV
jgi:hypothetical protein